MLQLNWLYAFLILALLGCQGTTKQSESELQNNWSTETNALFDKVIEYHDTLMIKWFEIRKVRNRLDELDSLADTTDLVTIREVKTDLKRSYDFMSDWMENQFQVPSDSTDNKAVNAYLKKHVTLLDSMETQMKASLVKGRLWKKKLESGNND